MNSLVKVLEQAAMTANGITFIQAMDKESFVSYKVLYKKACFILHNLQGKGLVAGDEVVIQVKDNATFLELFWACILGGFIPVPLAMGSQEMHKQKLLGVWKKLNNAYLFSDQSLNWIIDEDDLLRESAQIYHQINSRLLDERILTEETAPGDIAEIKAEDIAYIQFSSGSTGDPKGVVLTHANLMANITDIAKRSGTTKADRALSWLPLTHDMGLICFHLTSTLKQINQYLLPTTLFIRRPILWMDKANEHRATQLYSPNFGYQYILSAIASARQALHWNLKQVRIIYNGAEPISERICEEFLEEMATYGVQSNTMFAGYGLAEACVAVTLPNPGSKLKFVSVKRNTLNIGSLVEICDTDSDEDYVSFAVVGFPMDTCQLRICNDKDEELADQHIGHIQIKGLNVTDSYYNDPEVSVASITDDEWLKTGDLGFVMDGQLVITGRSKNIIIINGQNIYPHDIEENIVQKLDLKPGSILACGLPSTQHGEEVLVVFVQFRKSIQHFLLLSHQIQEVVLKDMGLEVRQVIPVKSIPKTTSGKVQRYVLADQFAEGAFNEVLEAISLLNKSAVQNEKPLLEQLTTIVCTVFNSDHFGVDYNFFDEGLDSLKATIFLSRLRQIGFELSIRDLFQYCTLQLLYDYLSNKEVAVYEVIEPQLGLENYRLASGQERFWLMDQANGGNAAANICCVSMISGPFNESSFRSSIETIVKRHDSLRTVFEVIEGIPHQRVKPYEALGFEIDFADLSGEENREVLVEEMCQNSASEPFDLSQGPLLRVKLIRLAADQYCFIFTIHHIISDGWSIDIISKELQSLYTNNHTDPSATLPALRLQYKDYVWWQQHRRTTEAYQSSKAYWLDHLSGTLPRLELPFSPQGGDRRLQQGRSLVYPIDREVTQQLKSLCQSKRVTVFTGLMSLLSSLLYRYTGQKDMIIGTDTAGRVHRDLEDQVGYYLNLLAIRIQIEEKQSFESLLGQVHEVLLSAYEHQDYPFDDLLEALSIQREVGRMPLFDILVLFQNFDNSLGFEGLSPDLEISSQAIDNGTSLNDLLLEFREVSDQLELKIRYNTAVYSAWQIDLLANHFSILAEQAVNDPEQAIQSLEILSSDQLEILFGFNQAPVSYADRPGNYIQLFEKQVSAHGKQLALVSGSRRISYATLNSEANRVAHHLNSTGRLKPNALIGLHCGRNEEMLYGMLGILKTGGAYVPLDTEYPDGRLGYMIKDSGLELLLVSADQKERVQKILEAEGLAEAVILISLDEARQKSDSSENPNYQINEEDLAYVIYTSGSTGRPKGVEISHQSLLDYVYTFTDYFELSSQDVVIQQSSISFDTAVEEIYPILGVGGRLVLSESGGRDVEQLQELIAREEVTILSSTPLVIQGLNGKLAEASSLRVLISGGDELKASYIDQLPAGLKVYNTYGPTESTVCATYQEVTDLDQVNRIGKPIANRSVYILNEQLQLQPVGLIGELYLGGSGLAKGYLHRPQLSAERFINNPHDDSERIYRTGDLGYWNADGSISFMGRKDSQVKVRGYRIETEEVERVMESCTAVTGAVVVSVSHEEEKYLVGYYTSETSLEAEELRGQLQEQLPEYMIPSQLLRLPNIPMTANGKLDRKALPAVGFKSQARFEAPRNEIEQQLASIWEEVLEIDQVSIHANFFAIGGHSLKAVQVLSRIHKALSVKLELKEMFQYPVLSEQAALIGESTQQAYEHIAPAPIQEHYPLSFAQRRLWVLDQLKIGAQAFNLSWLCTLSISNDAGPFNESSFRSSIETIVKRHDSLRTVFEVIEGIPHQRVKPYEALGFEIDFADLSGEENREVLVEEMCQNSASEPFDLSQGPLLRVKLIRLAADQYCFIFTIHHIISDGWSIDIISKELQSLYTNNHTDPSATLPALRLQYKDYVWWQQHRRTTEAYQSSKAYWLDHLSGTLPRLELPFSPQGGDRRLQQGRSLVYPIDREVTQQLKSLCQRKRVTVFTGLMSLLSSLLYRYTGQKDMIIGTDTAGRVHRDLEDQVGYYLNLLAIRLQVDEKQSFESLLGQVHEVLLSAYEHQDYPFDDLLEALSIQREVGRMPLFDILVLFQNFDNSLGFEGLSPDLEISSQAIDNGTSLNDLLLEFREVSDQLELKIRYNTAVYSAWQIDLLANHFSILAEQAVNDPEQAIQSLEILSSDQLEILFGFNQAPVSYADRAGNYIQLFEKQVSAHGKQLALVSGSRRISYATLNSEANRVAHHLNSTGRLKPNALIGLYCGRNEEMLYGMLGILKTGGANVPLDTEYPDGRLGYMIKDSGLELMLVSADQKERVQKILEAEGLAEAVILISLDEARQKSDSSENPNYQINEEDLAYVIYTSGSTGRPKGVEISHQSLLDYVYTFTDYFELSSQDVVIQQSSISFDTAVEEIYPILGVGGRLVLSESGGRDVEQLQELIAREEVTILSSTPLVIQGLNGKLAEASSLRVLISGGDELKASYIDQLPAGLKVYNTYGPTESTVCATYQEVTDLDQVNRIGKPIANRSVYILNEQLQLQPVGLIGELYLGGSGLAKGYLHRPQLSAEMFINNPYSGSDRIYRTGDLGYWNADGSISFMGRKDSQVKVRGYRIETEEVERVMESCTAVTGAVVVSVSHEEEKYLVGYYTSETSLEAEELRGQLQEQLPEYMIPSQLLRLPNIPMTANGKLDRKALPEVGFKSQARYEAPRNEIEQQLASIWEEVLEIDQVSIHANFFAIGGHSLKAVQVLSRIHKALSVKLELKEMFQYPVLSEQAALIGESTQQAYEQIAPAPIQEHYPLSFAQRRLWVLDQLSDLSAAYNVSMSHFLKGKLEEDVLEKAFSTLVERHEVLRTIIQTVDGEPRQFILPPDRNHFKIDYEDGSKVEQNEAYFKTKAIQIARIPFDLEAGPLVRVHLMKMAPEKHLLTLCLHHIISDEWSIQVMIRELEALYNHYVNKEEHTLANLAVHYKDFAVWQEETMTGEALAVHREYWLSQLQGELPQLNLVGTQPRPGVQTFNGRRQTIGLDQTLSRAFLEQLEENNATLFMGVLSLVKILLYRYTGQSDIIIGTPVSGRFHPDLENQLGFYLNTLPLRTRINEKENFFALLEQVRNTCLDGFKHQEYPFDLLVEDLQLPRDMSHSPIFDVMVVLEDMDRNEAVNLQGLAIEECVLDTEVSKFDLTFYFSKRQEELFLTIEFNSAIFNHGYISNLSTHLKCLLANILSVPSTSIARLNYLEKSEVNKILFDFNQTKVPFPKGITIIDLFENQVEQTPDNQALICQGEVLTYTELNAKVNQLAHYLRSQYQVQPEQLVGVLLDRTEWLVITLLGILKSGAAYLPIDKIYPEARIQYMLKDGGAKLLITDEVLPTDAPIVWLNLEKSWVEIEEGPCANPNKVNSASDLAYVMYTSGSTGQPKGVMIEQAGVVNLLQSVGREIDIQSEDKLLAVTTHAFDMSITEIFLPLVHGGSVLLADNATIHAPEQLKGLMSIESPSIMQATPGMWHVLVESGWTGGKDIRIITGGEALSFALGEKLIEYSGTIWNMYGPTESTVYSTYNQVKSREDIPSIGVPVSNMSAYILDDNLQLLPVGVAGILYVGGVGIARGYFNRADLTSERFIQNPFNPEEVIYNTGDLCSWTATGKIRYHGRKDAQVKIRGYRVELDEVESALLSHQSIDNVVVLSNGQQQDKHLVAYYLAQHPLDSSALRSFLRTTLPEYMIPTYFIMMDYFPLNGNGKIDKKLLPKPEKVIQAVYVAPQNPLEVQLTEIWQEVLDRDVVGMNDNFFELGGHSLKAVQLLSRIEKNLSVRLELKDIFLNPLLSDLVSQIELVKWAGASQVIEQDALKNDNIIL